jgi:hypothetical protein
MTRVSLRGRSAGVLLMTALSVFGSLGPVWAQADAERLRTAKTLFFDRKYAEARQAWEAVRVGGQGTWRRKRPPIGSRAAARTSARASAR